MVLKGNRNLNQHWAGAEHTLIWHSIMLKISGNFHVITKYSEFFKDMFSSNYFEMKLLAAYDESLTWTWIRYSTL